MDSAPGREPEGWESESPRDRHSTRLAPSLRQPRRGSSARSERLSDTQAVGGPNPLPCTRPVAQRQRTSFTPRGSRVRIPPGLRTASSVAERPLDVRVVGGPIPSRSTSSESIKPTGELRSGLRSGLRPRRTRLAAAPAVPCSFSGRTPDPQSGDGGSIPPQGTDACIEERSPRLAVNEESTGPNPVAGAVEGWPRGKAAVRYTVHGQPCRGSSPLPSATGGIWPDEGALPKSVGPQGSGGSSPSPPAAPSSERTVGAESCYP